MKFDTQYATIMYCDSNIKIGTAKAQPSELLKAQPFV